MITEPEIELVLEVYSFEDILEHNDISLEDTLTFLVDEGFLELPEIKPVTLWDTDTTPSADHSDDT